MEMELLKVANEVVLKLKEIIAGREEEIRRLLETEARLIKANAEVAAINVEYLQTIVGHEVDLEDVEANRDLYLRRWNEEIAKRGEAVALVDEGMELTIQLKAIIEGHETAMREVLDEWRVNPQQRPLTFRGVDVGCLVYYLRPLTEYVKANRHLHPGM